MERAAVAVQRAAEGIICICGNHLGDGIVAVVEVVGQLVILIIITVFLDVFAENIPVFGVGNDVGVSLYTFSREGVNHLEAGGLLASVRGFSRDGQRVGANVVGCTG